MRAVFVDSSWRREALRTNLWLVPTIEVIGAVVLFAVTRTLDEAAYRSRVALPPWVINGTADAARQILATLAAAVITVVGVVFSIIIVALTLTSTQFGPRMLRTFIRDRGAQLTLGTFVATFVYAILTLVTIGPGAHGDFVPHISITTTIGLVVVDLAVLIYFIEHITQMIQLPQVIAGIAADLSQAIDAQTAGCDPIAACDPTAGRIDDASAITAWLPDRMRERGGYVAAPASGYLQLVRHRELVRIAARFDAVIQVHYRPGHFLTQGQRLATVWPATAAGQVARTLAHAHITGPYRTLAQDVAFAVDQLVEIAIRALSPAVNDTFTALTCIDWLGDSLTKIAGRWQPNLVHRDAHGEVRLITAPVTYDRLVQRAFEKIRQASRGMPAVMIRQLQVLTQIMQNTTTPAQRQVLLEQAAMIQRANLDSNPEPADREDVQRRYDQLLALNSHLTAGRAKR
ncbi:DUF2254 domain-containing protein [Planosporangium sp. 12N6]|uniref:DUF2254 domain-containing protein n=1 Tax=Planosporangium spinosum TaxID=3402278 RepID=UPI003CFA5D72